MNWVSVDERLPDADAEVLVAAKDGYVFVAWLPDNDEGGWRHEYGRVVSWITHWMPLPEPPK